MVGDRDRQVHLKECAALLRAPNYVTARKVYAVSKSMSCDVIAISSCQQRRLAPAPYMLPGDEQGDEQGNEQSDMQGDEPRTPSHRHYYIPLLLRPPNMRLQIRYAAQLTGDPSRSVGSSTSLWRTSTTAPTKSSTRRSTNRSAKRPTA